jgi:flagellar biosynthesis/type III secretory pathway protein FliH
MNEQVDKWDAPNLGGIKTQAQNAQPNEQDKQAGFEKGYQEGLAKAQEELAQQLTLVQNLIQQIPNFKEMTNEASVQIMHSYCQHIIKKVIMSEISQDNMLHQLIEKGTSMLTTQDMISVDVNPELFSDKFEKLKSELSEKGITLNGNPNCSLTEVTIHNQNESLQTDLFAMVDTLMKDKES